MKWLGLAVILALFVACDLGGEINLDVVLKHTAEVVAVESSLLGEKQVVFVNLSWTWTYQRPDNGTVIVERSLDDSLGFVALDTLPMDSLMTFTDTDSVLHPERLVYYRLSRLYGTNVETFITTDVRIPAAQDFTQPSADTISSNDSTVTVAFAPIAGMDTTDVAIYQGGPTSIDSLLEFLTNPLFDTTITDTIVTFGAAEFGVDTVYTIRIRASKMAALDYITDTSIGFRAFLRH